MRVWGKTAERNRHTMGVARAAVAGIVLGAAAIVAGLAAIGYYAWMDAQKP